MDQANLITIQDATARLEQLGAPERMRQERDRREHEAERQALLDELLIDQYLTAHGDAMLEVCKTNHEQYLAEQRQREASRETKISGFSAAQIEEVERRRKAMMEESNNYRAEQQVTREEIDRTKAITKQLQQRYAERLALWQPVKKRGVKRKDITSVETFKKWLSGKYYLDGCASDIAIRDRLRELSE
jgi:hypothetical protein